MTVTDNLDPTITAPADASGTTNAGCTSTNVALGTPVTSDNCSVASVTNDAPEAFPLGVTTVTWTVTDGSGRKATATQIITVTDTENPIITVPQTVSVNADAGKCTATGVILGIPVTSDNCAIAAVTNNAVEPFSPGNTIITWTVTDRSGNSSTATQVVIVIDTEDPSITAPQAVTVNTDAGKNSASGVNLGIPVVSDNCSVVSATNNAVQPFALGETIVTWTVADVSGNTSTSTQKVTVVDREKPLFSTCMTGENLQLKTALLSSHYTLSGVLYDAVATDNDRIASLTYVLTGATIGEGTSLNGVTLNAGETIITWTAVDSAGNTSTCQFTANVIDTNIPPVAVDDLFTVKESTELTGDVRSNDSDIILPVEMLKVKLVNPASHGKLVINENGTFKYTPDYDFIGEDHFVYEISKPGNEALGDQANVTITVTENSDCTIFVPNAFSPGGDGINEYFKIRCIYNYPNALLKIYTRSGILVYEQKHYGNIDFWGSEIDAFWNGQTGNKWNVGGNELMSATYIYILELEEGKKNKVITGSVFLNK